MLPDGWDMLWSKDKEGQNQAYTALLAATEEAVPWAYEAWDELLARLGDSDNHVRAIAAQLLCNLARSDPERRMVGDFSALLAMTRDPRFVTARHSLQALWRVGLAGPEQRQLVVEGLAGRFADCLPEKNHTLIRFDIQQGLRNLYDHAGDETIRTRALELIEQEADPKYRQKYARLWRTPRSSG